MSGQGFSRRFSSASTQSRMNCARLPGPMIASMRSSISGESRTAVNLPIAGRPMRGGLSDNVNFAKSVMFPLSPIDSNRYRVDISVIGYGGKQMYKPYTPNQFKVLAAAFRGCATSANIETRRAKTRAVNDMVSAKLVYGTFDGRPQGLTPEGLRAYVDMCERYDADSGCIAYMERAQEARAALAAT